MYVCLFNLLDIHMHLESFQKVQYQSNLVISNKSPFTDEIKLSVVKNNYKCIQ